MGILLTPELTDRLAGNRPFLVNDIFDCTFDATILSAGVSKIQIRDDYDFTSLISGDGAFSPVHGDAVFFMKAKGFNGPFPGLFSRIKNIDAAGLNFTVDYSLPHPSSYVPASLLFCSPADIGFFCMFGHSTIEAFTGDVPLPGDNLDALTPACRFFDILYDGIFDAENYDSYCRLVYDKTEKTLSSSSLVGTPVSDGDATWIKVSTYCRERASLSVANLVKYSFIVPLEENSTVYMDGPLVTAQPCSLSFKIKI